jgi:hypothetical protein
MHTRPRIYLIRIEIEHMMQLYASGFLIQSNGQE